MKAHLPAVAVLVFTSIAIAGAQAQTVYRCGNDYSQSPCPAGKAIQVDDARTAEQKKLSEEVTRRDRKAADEMEKARLKQEAQASRPVIPPQRAASADKPAVHAKRPPVRRKPIKPQPEYFTPTDGKTKPKTRKARDSAA